MRYIQISKADLKSRCEYLCRFITFDIFDYKIVKIGLLYLSLCFSCFWIFQTFLFCYKADIRFFIQYGPMYFTSLYLILCVFSLYSFSKIMTTFVKTVQSWKIPCVKEIEDNFVNELFLTTLFCIVTACLALLTSVLFIIPTDQDKSLYFIVFISEEYLIKAQTFLSWSGRLSFLPLTYISVVQPSLRIRCCWIQLKYHVQICLYRFKSLSTKNVFIDDEIIEKEIKFCVDYHSRIYLSFNQMIKAVQVYILPFQIVATLLIINIVVYYFWFQDSLIEQYPRLVSLGITTFITFVNLIQAGQEVDDVSSGIFESLIDVNWYDWNEKNKKLYLIFLTNSLKPLRIKYSENIALNYQMGVEIMKTFFSFISVMYKLQK